jgi:GTPase
VPAGNDVPSVAITGYTNAGKPALLNRLAGSDVLVEGKLFATLDPTVRWVVNQGCTYTLTDTVGSMRNLPHQLVDAFRSTLEEVVHADLALHVVDASALTRWRRSRLFVACCTRWGPPRCRSSW